MVTFTPNPIHGQGSFKSIEVDCIELESVYLLHNDTFNIRVEIPKYAKDKDLDISLQREFDFLWRNYAMEKDDNLTLDALRLKKALLELRK